MVARIFALRIKKRIKETNDSPVIFTLTTNLNNYTAVFFYGLATLALLLAAICRYLAGLTP